MTQRKSFKRRRVQCPRCKQSISIVVRFIDMKPLINLWKQYRKGEFPFYDGFFLKPYDNSKKEYEFKYNGRRCTMTEVAVHKHTYSQAFLYLCNKNTRRPCFKLPQSKFSKTAHIKRVEYCGRLDVCIKTRTIYRDDGIFEEDRYTRKFPPFICF